MLPHAARAIAPTLPAVLVVLGARLVETGSRSAGLAITELVAYLVVTVVATSPGADAAARSDRLRGRCDRSRPPARAAAAVVV